MRNRARLGVLLSGAIAMLALGALRAPALGAGETVSLREVGGFDRVSFSTSGQLIITQGEREALEIEARAAELPHLITEVRGGTLFIGREGGGPLIPFGAPVFRLTLRRVAGLETHSSGRISAQSLRAGSLQVRISSSGRVTLDRLTADELEVQISSSGSFSAAGRVQRQTIRLSSSGSYSAGNLESSTARVNVSSSGSATLRVSDSLEANVTSSGSVRYYGSPPRVEANVTSSGRLVRLGS